MRESIMAGASLEIGYSEFLNFIVKANWLEKKYALYSVIKVHMDLCYLDFFLLLKDNLQIFYIVFLPFFQVLLYIHWIHLTETPRLIFCDYRFRILKGLRMSGNFHIYSTLLNLGRNMLTKHLQVYAIQLFV